MNVMMMAAVGPEWANLVLDCVLGVAAAVLVIVIVRTVVHCRRFAKELENGNRRLLEEIAADRRKEAESSTAMPPTLPAGLAWLPVAVPDLEDIERRCQMFRREQFGSENRALPEIRFLNKEIRLAAVDVPDLIAELRKCRAANEALLEANRLQQAHNKSTSPQRPTRSKGR